MMGALAGVGGVLGLLSAAEEAKAANANNMLKANKERTAGWTNDHGPEFKGQPSYWGKLASGAFGGAMMGAHADAAGLGGGATPGVEEAVAAEPATMNASAEQGLEKINAAAIPDGRNAFTPVGAANEKLMSTPDDPAMLAPSGQYVNKSAMNPARPMPQAKAPQAIYAPKYNGPMSPSWQGPAQSPWYNLGGK